VGTLPIGKTWLSYALLESTPDSETRLLAKRSRNSATVDSLVNSNPQQALDGCPADAVLHPSPSVSPSSSTFAISQTAKTLERMLFQQSKQNLATYRDMSTLDDRLRNLMTILIRRRMLKKVGGQQKRGKSDRIMGTHSTRSIADNAGSVQRKAAWIPTAPSANSTDRVRILMGILGVQKYQEIVKLIREIQLVKTKRVAKLCGSQGCDVQTASTTRMASTFLTNLLPSAVRQLYFGTPLLDCWERYPLDSLEHLPWNQLQKQAQQNLLSFQIWEMAIGEGK
jgi:hypothetical protein